MDRTGQDWVAVAKLSSTEPILDSTRVKLWQDDNYCQDIDLPGCLPALVNTMAMEIPFLTVSINLREDTCIKVYRLATEMLMEDISAFASLIKSFPLGRFANQLFCNELFFGCVLDDQKAVILIEKGELFDAAILPENIERILVLLQDDASKYCVGMNTTSLVFAPWEKEDKDEGPESEDEDEEQESEEDKDLDQVLGEEDQEHGYKEEKDQEDGSGVEEVVSPLYKKDFWMTNKIVLFHAQK